MKHEHMQILKLVYAGFSTRELHKIYNAYQTFNLNFRRVMPLLISLLNCKHQTLSSKITKFYALDEAHILTELEQKQIHTVFYNDNDYPTLLRQIYDFPFLLFVRGNRFYLNEKKFLAVVGSRNATDYTANVLEQIMPDLVSEHICIVSGLAKGADNYAHLSCNYHNGKTIGVLAFGHDFVYPEDTAIIRGIMENVHLVISEYAPHTPIQKFRFPERNRIISGLCQGVLITEAKVKSGSMITIDQALDQNRNVYCIPGRIDNELSMGCNYKIKEGAKLVQCAHDILEDFQ